MTGLFVHNSAEDSSADWFLSNAAWGHLDEVPDAVLRVCVLHEGVANFGAAVLQGIEGGKGPDDYEGLMDRVQRSCPHKLHEAAQRLKSWCLMELARRQHLIVREGDVLLREIVRDRVTAMRTPKGEAFTGRIQLYRDGQIRVIT